MGTYGVSQAYMDFWGLAQYDTPDYQYVTLTHKMLLH